MVSNGSNWVIFRHYGDGYCDRHFNLNFDFSLFQWKHGFMQNKKEPNMHTDLLGYCSKNGLWKKKIKTERIKCISRKINNHKSNKNIPKYKEPVFVSANSCVQRYLDAFQNAMPTTNKKTVSIKEFIHNVVIHFYYSFLWISIQLASHIKYRVYKEFIVPDDYESHVSITVC